jgi:hypothetical protein
MRAALYAFGIAAVVLAWAVAMRRPSHRPIAWALSAGLAANMAQAVLLGRVLPPPNFDPSTPPFEGTLRWAVYVERALFIAWPALLAGVALRLLARRAAWPVAVGYVAAVIFLAVSYPWTRFDTLRRALLIIDLCALAVEIVSLAAWHFRTWRRERADIATTIAIVLIAGHFATVVAGPYRLGLFGEAWKLAQLVYFMNFATVTLLQLGALIWPQTSD